VHRSLTCIYIPNFIEIGKTFVEELTAGTPPNSRSRDTKTSLGQIWEIWPDEI